MRRNPCILILTDFALRMPQRIYWQESFDLDYIQRELEENGCETIVTHYEDPCLIQICADLDWPFVLPATSYHPGYRSLVNATLAALQANGARLIPSLAHFLAYENKILMSRMIASRKIPSPKTYVISTYEEFQRAVAELGLPVVIKEPQGFGSSNVSLLRTSKEVEIYLKDNFKRGFIGTNNKSHYVAETRGLNLCLVQEFIPGLEGDWRVKLYGDRGGSLYRRARPDDFRASGSGLTKRIKAPDEIFEFAWNVQQALGCPWVSCDIAESKNGIVLFEYQVVHYCTGELEDHKQYYVRQAPGRWETVEGNFPLEKEMVRQVMQFIKNGSNA